MNTQDDLVDIKELADSIQREVPGSQEAAIQLSLVAATLAVAQQLEWMNDTLRDIYSVLGKIDDDEC